MEENKKIQIDKDKNENVKDLYAKMSNLYGNDSEINDSVTIQDRSILEFIYTYDVPEYYSSRSLVTQYRLIIDDESKDNKYSLSDLYNLSNNIILNKYISSIFSNKVKFTSYQLKIYESNNLTSPLLSTRKEYIPGVYGKLQEPPIVNKSYKFTFKLKTTESETNTDQNMPKLWYRDLYLLGIPEIMGHWDNPDYTDDRIINALNQFILAFSIIRYKHFGVYCMGVNRGTKNEFLRENLVKDPKIISLTPKGFERKV